MLRSMGWHRRALAVAAVGLASLMLVACDASSPVAFQGSDITGTHLGRDMAMQDASGATRSLNDYKGKVVVVFFGYTQCPDVCPTSMAQLAQTMTLLGDDASQVQVIMVSVDPQRDTPAVLGEYVKAFDPRFVGLTGTPEQLGATAKSFKAYYGKSKGASGDQYTMDHSSSFYLFDKKGESRVLVRGDASPEDIAKDIRQLL